MFISKLLIYTGLRTSLQWILKELITHSLTQYWDCSNIPPCPSLFINLKATTDPFLYGCTMPSSSLPIECIRLSASMHQTWNRCSNRQWLSPCPELLYINSCLKAFFYIKVRSAPLLRYLSDVPLNEAIDSSISSYVDEISEAGWR